MSKLESMPSREKALQAAAEEVSLRQLSIQQGSVSEANSEAIDVSTFKAKEDISALSLMEEAKMILDDLEPGHAVRKLHKHLHRASRSLSNHAQAGSLMNDSVRYASVAMVDVGARTVD